MKIHRFFIQQSLKTGDLIELTPELSHRCTNVLRLKLGAPCILFNGQPDEYQGTIHTIGRIVKVLIIEPAQKNNIPSLEIHLGQVISKREKMDFVIQKATELGVHKVTPLFSERTNVQLSGERLEKKILYFQKIAIHAAEQCGRTVVPTIESPTLFQDWISNRLEKTRLILSPTAAHSFKDIEITGNVAVLIGAEGGFTKTELKEAIQSGFQEVKLGPRILRTETATLVALSLLQYKAGDLAH